MLQINSVWRMLVDFLANIIGYDSKLFSSIRGLFFPGFLTSEYLANRRASYLTPIRLFIFLMFATFVVMSYLALDDVLQTKDDTGDDGLSLQFNIENKSNDSEVQNKYFTVLEKGYQSLRYEVLLLQLDTELTKHFTDTKQLDEELTQKLITSENKQKIQTAITENKCEIKKLQESTKLFKNLWKHIRYKRR